MAGSTIGLVVADVSGHGFGPALLMARCEPSPLADRASRRARTKSYSDAKRLLSGEWERSTHHPLMGKLDPKSRTMGYLNAGHPSAYLLDASGNVQAALESRVMPLGILPDLVFSAGRFRRLGTRRHSAAIWTDGILEAQAADGTQSASIGRWRFSVPIATGLRGTMIEALHRAVLRLLRGIIGLADDVRRVVVKVDA